MKQEPQVNKPTWSVLKRKGRTEGGGVGQPGAEREREAEMRGEEGRVREGREERRGAEEERRKERGGEEREHIEALT